MPIREPNTVAEVHDHVEVLDPNQREAFNTRLLDAARQSPETLDRSSALIRFSANAAIRTPEDHGSCVIEPRTAT